MAVGQGANVSVLSYVAIGRETTLGTYNTCTSALDFLSSGLKTVQENKILESLTRRRVYKDVIKMGKVVEGELQFYFRPEDASCNYLLQNALGGALSVATATGESAGGDAFTHTYELGSMDQTYTSICINERKGGSTGGKVFQYSGLRVNELAFTAELDDALICRTSLIGFDSTTLSNDVESALTLTTSEVLSFTNGRLSVESTLGSLTSSSFWEVQSMEFTLSNNLKADNESRRVGSDILQVLPVGIAGMELKATVRYDTTTAYDAMLAKTQFSAEFEFQGSTMAGSVIRKGLKLSFPKVYINDAGDPEIGGPDEMLTSEVTFNIMQATDSATAYAVKAYVTNLTANYD